LDPFLTEFFVLYDIVYPLQIAQSSIKEIITKVQSSDAWGAVSSWTEDKFKEVDSLLNGFDPAELADVGAAAFKGAMDSFGKIDRWTSEQADILSKKAKTAWGGVKKATAAELRKARGFLNGFTTQDLADVTTDIFASAVDAFDNGRGQNWCMDTGTSQDARVAS